SAARIHDRSGVSGRHRGHAVSATGRGNMGRITYVIGSQLRSSAASRRRLTVIPSGATEERSRGISRRGHVRRDPPAPLVPRVGRGGRCRALIITAALVWMVRARPDSGASLRLSSRRASAPSVVPGPPGGSIVSRLPLARTLALALVMVVAASVAVLPPP